MKGLEMKRKAMRSGKSGYRIQWTGWRYRFWSGSRPWMMNYIHATTVIFRC